VDGVEDRDPSVVVAGVVDTPKRLAIPAVVSAICLATACRRLNAIIALESVTSAEIVPNRRGVHATLADRKAIFPRIAQDPQKALPELPGKVNVSQ